MQITSTPPLLPASSSKQATIGSTTPHPIPLSAFPDGRAEHAQGHFLQFNTIHIKNSQHETNDLLTQQNLLVACIQDTKLIPTSTAPILDKYTIERRDRPTSREADRGWHNI